ncbi:MAG: hypothetical protein JO236_02530 [Mycobacterium sp.]|nr:hypothetical protein [Mycobacterium sp.]MBW0016414.1 hypothetical protein [Mycobacterium sp.]
MGFVIQWFVYLLAFAAGSGVAWAVVTRTIKPAGEVDVAGNAPGGTGTLG